MNPFITFQNSCLDTACIGLDPQKPSALDFLPADAVFIGWNPSQELCFCFLPDCGETVFAATAEGTVPVSQDFSSFLGLIIACKGTGILPKAVTCSRTFWDEHIEMAVLSAKERSVLRALQNSYHPDTPEDPWLSIRLLQQTRKAASVPEDAQTATWAVTYTGSGRSGRLIPIDKHMENWYFPAAYSCSEGIVLDCCIGLDAAALRTFQASEKAAVLPDWEQQLSIQNADPFSIRFVPYIRIDGKLVKTVIAQTLRWIPWEENSRDVLQWLEHYDLDPEIPWHFVRINAVHRGKKREIKGLQLVLDGKFTTLAGLKMTDPAPGSTYAFSHPGLGTHHTLTVMSSTQEELDPNFLYDVPRHYRLLRYTVAPAIDPIWLNIRDRQENDPSGTFSGDAPSPSAILPARAPGSPVRTAVSAFHYQAADSVTWQLLLRSKLQQDATWTLI